MWIFEEIAENPPNEINSNAYHSNLCNGHCWRSSSPKMREIVRLYWSVKNLSECWSVSLDWRVLVESVFRTEYCRLWETYCWATPNIRNPLKMVIMRWLTTNLNKFYSWIKKINVKSLLLIIQDWGNNIGIGGIMWRWKKKLYSRYCSNQFFN